MEISEQPEQPVIVNPDRFLPRPGVHCHFPRFKQRRGQMCEACLYGQHQACFEESCPCVHRELQ